MHFHHWFFKFDTIATTTSIPPSIPVYLLSFLKFPKWGQQTHEYSVQSLYKVVNFLGIKPVFVSTIWDIKIPPRVHYFLWLLSKNKLLTRDNYFWVRNEPYTTGAGIRWGGSGFCGVGWRLDPALAVSGGDWIRCGGWFCSQARVSSRTSDE